MIANLGMIEQEGIADPPRRITSIEPWPEAVIARAFKRVGREWDAIEETAVLAQGKPDFND